MLSEFIKLNREIKSLQNYSWVVRSGRIFTEIDPFSFVLVLLVFFLFFLLSFLLSLLMDAVNAFSSE